MATKGKDRRLIQGQITFDFYNTETKVKQNKPEQKKEKVEKKSKPVKTKHLKIIRKI